MTNRKKLRGNIVTPNAVVYGDLVFEDTIVAIEAIAKEAIAQEAIAKEAIAQKASKTPSLASPGSTPLAPHSSACLVEPDAPIILPGFVDLHIHGGGGADVMQGGQAVKTLAAYHASVGTTALMATTVTAPFDQLAEIITGVGATMARQHSARTAKHGCPESRVLGVHLEGPYISPHKLGAQPDHVQSFDREQLTELGLGEITKIVTVASECVGEPDQLAWLAAQGVKVQLGHSAASYEECEAALCAGAHGFTHLFNAMTGFHHRQPGVVGAALAHATYSELIADGIHVHPGAIKAALRAIPKLYCVSDATAAAGMPDGQFALGDHLVTKCPNGVYLPDGTLAGSSSCLYDALKTMIAVGESWPSAVRRVATYPADYAQMPHIGRLQPGCMSDIVVLEPNLQIREIYLSGNLL